MSARLSLSMVPFWGRCTTHFSLFYSGDWDVHGTGLGPMAISARLSLSEPPNLGQADSFPPFPPFPPASGPASPRAWNALPNRRHLRPHGASGNETASLLKEYPLLVSEFVQVTGFPLKLIN